MRSTSKMRQLLARMAGIERMERGRVCPMTGRPHYNHQTWQAGRNVVRYVPVDQVAFLKEAIDGYTRFMTLAEQYAEEVIRRTRAERAATFRKHPATQRRPRGS